MILEQQIGISLIAIITYFTWCYSKIMNELQDIKDNYLIENKGVTK